MKKPRTRPGGRTPRRSASRRAAPGSVGPVDLDQDCSNLTLRELLLILRRKLSRVTAEDAASKELKDGNERKSSVDRKTQGDAKIGADSVEFGRLFDRVARKAGVGPTIRDLYEKLGLAPPARGARTRKKKRS